MPTYSFICNMTSMGKGYVEANTVEEARRKILKGYYDDIYDETDQSITEIIEITEDKE